MDGVLANLEIAPVIFLTIPETTPRTNPAMILATPALPAALVTRPEQMVGVLDRNILVFFNCVL